MNNIVKWSNKYVAQLFTTVSHNNYEVSNKRNEFENEGRAIITFVAEIVAYGKHVSIDPMFRIFHE